MYSNHISPRCSNLWMLVPNLVAAVAMWQSPHFAWRHWLSFMWSVFTTL